VGARGAGKCVGADSAVVEPFVRRALRRFRALWLFSFVVVCGGLLIVHGGALWSALPPWSQWRFDWIAVSVFIQCVTWLALAKAWVGLVRGATGHGIAMIDALNHQALVSLGKYLPGKVWGMVARGGLMRRWGMSARDVIELSFLEQILVLHSAACVALLSAAWLLSSVRTELSALLLVVALVGLLLGRPAVVPTVRWLASRLTRSSIGSVSPLPSHITYMGWLFWYVLSWVLFGLVAAAVSAVVLPSLDLNLQSSLWFVLATTISMTLGFVALFAPAGLGVRDASLGWVLASWMTPVDAALAVIVIRMWSILADAAIGCVLIMTGTLEDRRDQ